MNSLMSFAFKLAFGLGAAGLLVPATRWMMIEAAKSHQQGLISLSKLNRALQVPLTKKQRPR